MTYNKPTDVISAMITSGITKINLSPRHLMIRSLLSGGLLGIGTSLAFTAIVQTGLGITGAILFPACFVIVIILGLELVTGSFAVLPIAYFDKKMRFAHMAKNLCMVYIGNLLGSLLYALLFWVSITNLGHTPDSPLAAAIIKAAEGKTLHYAQYGFDGTITAFSKAILCNWMVTMAVVMAFASNAAGGKILGAWLPILIFFAQGYEHAVVNMFLIPAGMLLGAKISFSDWWLYNQIPVTIGNIIGGSIFTGLALYTTYHLKKPSPKTPEQWHEEDEANGISVESITSKMSN
ncbi:formate/nitrite transporter family protein [Arachidicoccus terrestris]|uniref:formate/nitrite transporter family protein n=1 Tax=Arachidicoccus terrestris TaxID=2875539 RepID=UPI001CC36F73|nr:formate/nitrite transporter family protein [Arachidicoccus terrestris]UAY53850.1 formate/nitrite transporter family protein [Arachidicoccus terrestris]